MLSGVTAEDFYNEDGLVNILNEVKSNRFRLPHQDGRFIEIAMPAVLMCDRKDLEILLNTSHLIHYMIKKISEYIYKNDDQATRLSQQIILSSNINSISRIFLNSYTSAERVDKKYLEWMKTSYYHIMSGENIALGTRQPKISKHILHMESRAAAWTYSEFNNAMEQRYRKLMQDDPTTWWNAVQELRKFEPDRKQVFEDMKDCGIRLIRHFAE